MDINTQLRALYTPAMDAFAALRAGGASKPLLMEVPDAYHQAPVKLMVVGQQTLGWGERRDSLDDLLDEYREFDLGRDCRRSHFWQAAHKLHAGLNPDGPKRAFLWSNLVKVDQRGHRPEPAMEDAACRLGLLEREIAITRPDVVIFFTGAYHDRLQSTFPGLSVVEFPSFARLKHPALPVHSYRTYHPRYLRLSRRWRVLDEIVSHCRDAA